MKEITSYTSIFRDITQGNYLYVEKKTEHIWNPVKSYKEICFMVRSERFGKSLKVSTLEAVFHGKNDQNKQSDRKLVQNLPYFQILSADHVAGRNKEA